MDDVDRFSRSQLRRKRLVIVSIALLLIGLVIVGAPALLFARATGPSLAVPQAEFNAGATSVIEVPDPPIRYNLFAVVPNRDAPAPSATVSATDAAGEDVARSLNVDFWKEALGRSFKHSAVLTPTVAGPMTISIEADATEDFALFPHEIDLVKRESRRWMPFWIAGGVMLAAAVLCFVGFLFSVVFGPDRPVEHDVPGL